VHLSNWKNNKKLYLMLVQLIIDMDQSLNS
jgi:hypothetical protein